MNEYLKNKISIGLSLDMSLKDYKRIFEKYRGYIHSIYFSPPLNGKYHSRKQITEQFLDERNVKKFYEIIDLAKEEGILLDCVLNRPTISTELVEGAFDCIRELDVDQITCLARHIAIIDEAFPDVEKIYSYNNDFNIKQLPTVPSEFSTIVVGKYFLRSTEYLTRIRDAGFKLKLLVNNGCSYNCQGCGKGNRECQKTFFENLEKYGLNYLYALQSFYPQELQELLDKVDIPVESIKISNRTDGATYLDKCLDSYINLTDPKTYIEERPANFRLWSRLGWFNPYLKELDNNEIIKIKQKGFNE